MIEWLPSEIQWLSKLSERVFEGEIILVRAIPRWGLTALCAAVAGYLGESAVVVDGRNITELNQKAFREKLDAKVRATVDTTGAAQLLFDNYGHAIRRSQGGHLHSMLYSLLVDSPTARDTGALLTARPNDMLDPGFSGSPLISRARTVVLPALEKGDADKLGMELNELKGLSGDSTWLARRFLDGGPRQGRVSAVEHLTHDRHRIVEALPPAAVSRLADAADSGQLDVISRESLMCLGRVRSEDKFEPSALVVESGLIDEVQVQNPTWPANLHESVVRFVDLLSGAEDAIWVDRYLFSQPSHTRAFLDQVRALTSTRLRLLVSDDRDRATFGSSVAEALGDIDGVEVRFMYWSDRKQLHDRHLIVPSLRKGFVLPTANVVLAVDTPGTAIAARIPAVDYSQYWGRATRVFPVS